MSLASALLTFRIQRFEATIIVGATVLSVLVSAAVIGLFNAGGYARCATDESLALTSLCQSAAATWIDRIARTSLSIVPIYPVLVGLLAGGPIVARELETGTARLAWSLGPSRLRWFAQRTLPMLALIAVAGLAIGLTAEALTHLLHPAVDLDRSFVGFRQRGVAIAAESVLIGAVALAVGAILGRSIPTLVLSLVLVFGIGMAVDHIDRQLLTSGATVGQEFDYDSVLWLDSRFQLPDGTLATWDELVAIHPEIAQNGFDESTGIRDVTLYVPGERYREVDLREEVALAALAAVFVGLAAVVVVRRRPR